MAARAIWKGVLRLGEAAVPVKLYSAVEDRKIHFRLLHQKDHVPLEQRMVHPSTGEPVPREEIRRGFELDDGRFVLLSGEELDALEPEPSRDIELTRFVPPGAIANQWFERPYRLGPDGSSAPYFALAEALERRGRIGVARWTMRKKRYLGALRHEGGYLALVTLRYAGEVVAAEALAPPSGRELSKKETGLAEQLVSALEGDFDPADFEDEYRRRVWELIEAKSRGETIEFRRPPPAREEEALDRALEQSVRAARQRKTA